MEASPSLFALLEKYLHVTDKAPDDTMMNIPLAELMQDETLRKLLEMGRVQYKATSKELPASFLGLSLFSLCGALHYVAAAQNAWLDFSLDNMNFFLESHNDHMHAGYQIKEVRFQPLPEAGPERELALLAAFEAFFQSYFNALLNTIAEVADVKPDMIWNQFPARLTFMQDFLLASETRPEIRARIVEGHRVLTEAIEPAVFNRRKNPFRHLKPVYIESPYEAGKTVLMRSSCCMYNCREGGELCYTCPKMLPEERERIKIEKLAQAK